MFRVSARHGKLYLALTKAVGLNEDFFGKETFLTVSGQLNAEAYACALLRLHVRPYVPVLKTQTQAATH